MIFKNLNKNFYLQLKTIYLEKYYIYYILMKILNETLKYISKNFIFVLAFAIIPACFIGGMLQPFSILSFLINYNNSSISNFGDVLVGLFGMNWMQVINWVFASIILILVLSALLGNIENHFRSGKLNLASSTGFINNNVLATSVYFLFYIVAYLVFKFLLALFIFILHIVFGRLGLTPSVVLLVFVIIFSTVALAFFAMLFMYLMLGLIDTLNSGYSFRTSMSNVGELLRNKSLKILIMVILPFCLVIPIVMLGNLFGFATISNIVTLILLFIYYPVLGYTCYYELSGITRYDNIKNYFKS